MLTSCSGREIYTTTAIHELMCLIQQVEPTAFQTGLLLPSASSRLLHSLKLGAILGTDELPHAVLILHEV
jgi:hypothetical protein